MLINYDGRCLEYFSRLQFDLFLLLLDFWFVCNISFFDNVYPMFLDIHLSNHKSAPQGFRQHEKRKTCHGLRYIFVRPFTYIVGIISHGSIWKGCVFFYVSILWQSIFVGSSCIFGQDISFIKRLKHRHRSSLTESFKNVIYL